MRSKRFKKLPTNTSKLKANDFENVLKEVKKNCTTKFDESIDLNMQINHKQKKSEINFNQLVIDVELEDIISTILFLKTNEKCKFKQLIDNQLSLIISKLDYYSNFYLEMLLFLIGLMQLQSFYYSFHFVSWE